jgi:branched-chain amino acid transport system ATP-binding protein
VCDEVYVLDLGRIIAAGPPAVIRRDEMVLAAYLGDP